MKAQLPLELSIQSFLLYRLRFVLSDDLCSAWHGFGGLGSQLSHLCIVINMDVIETVGIALTYHNLLFPKLTEKARQRSAGEADFATMLSAEQFDIREQAKRENTAAKPQPAKASHPEKKHSPGRSPKRAPSRSPFREKNSPRRNRSRTPARKAQPARNRRQARKPQRPFWAPSPLCGISLA